MSKTVVAIIPYGNGYLGFVAIEYNPEGRSQIVYADTFEACGLEALPEIVAGKDKRRVFDDSHWLALKAQMDTLLLAYRPERILCDVPSVRSTLAVKVAEAVLEYLDDYTEVNSLPDAERIPSAWMSVYGGPIARDEMRQAIAANFDHDESIELRYDGTLRAAAMASYCLFGAGNIEKMPRVHRPRNSEPKPARGDCPTFEAAPVEPTVIDTTGEPVAPVEVAPPITGRIVAGLDSGSRSLAIAIGQGDARPVALRYLRTFDVGESVPLPRPKIIKYAGGVEHVVTTKRVLSAEFVTKLADDVVAILRQQGVERLIVEHVDSVHVSADQIKAASSIATALIRTVWLATEIAVRARFAGIEVVRVRHISWIAKVCGKLRDEDGVRMLPEAVREAVRGWPLGANEHEYDAAGIMVYGVLAEEEIVAVTEKQERKSAAPVMKYPRKSKEQIKRERREAVGCKCTTKHQTGCPLYKPSRSVPAWAAKMLESAK